MLIVRFLIVCFVMFAMGASMFSLYEMYFKDASLTTHDTYLMGVATCAWLSILARGANNAKER